MKRIRWAKQMREWFGPDANIMLDLSGDLWTGAKNTLMSYKPGDTHMLVLQDDILPCKDIVETAKLLMTLRPDDPITLFSNKARIEQCKLQNVHWLKMRKWLMAQAYIVPVALIKEFLAWEALHIDQRIYFDDNRWAMFLFYTNRWTYATAPSLVEHLGWNGSTLSAYRDNGQPLEARLRMANWFIGFEASGKDIDWSDLRYVEDPDGNNSDFSSYYK